MEINKERKLDIVNSNDSKTAPRPKEWVNDLKALLLSKKARKVLFALIALIALRIAINGFLHSQVAKKDLTVRVFNPQITALDSSMTLPGNMEAIEQASLFSHVSGYLKKLYVDEGDQVKKGQILAEIDAPDVVDDYSKAKAEFDFRNTTRTRYLELLKESVISQQEFDNINANYDEARARFNTASANMEYTKIRAPFDGQIARRFKYPGDLIGSGSKGSESPIFMIVNERHLRAVINIPQSEVSNVKMGHLVDLRLDSFPGQVFNGTVSRMDPLLDQNTKTQRVLIDINNSDDKLHAGMFASVVLHFHHKENALVIPKDALETVGEKNFVYVFSEGRAKRVPVTIGLKSGESVEVLEGLTPKDLVIAKGLIALQDGMAVQTTPMEKKSETD